MTPAEMDHHSAELLMFAAVFKSEADNTNWLADDTFALDNALQAGIVLLAAILDRLMGIEGTPRMSSYMRGLRSLRKADFPPEHIRNALRMLEALQGDTNTHAAPSQTRDTIRELLGPIAAQLAAKTSKEKP